MARQPGYTFKIRVNGAVMSCANVEAQDARTEQDATGSEDNGDHYPVGGKRRRQYRITQATFDDSSNPFSAPISLFAGAIVSFQYYINGVGGDSWFCSSALVIESDQRGDVGGLQPVTFTLVGVGSSCLDPGDN